MAARADAFPESSESLFRGNSTASNRRGLVFLSVENKKQRRPGTFRERTLMDGASCGSFGGAERDRTAGLLVANEALSQLSYSPTRLFDFNSDGA